MSQRPIAYVKSAGKKLPLSSIGIPVAFETEHFSGTVCFVHRLSSDDGDSLAPQSQLAAFEHWELQLQGSFKTDPTGELCFGCNFPKMPFGLNSILKAICSKLFDGVKIKKHFGNGSETFCMPAIETHRLYRSHLGPIELPVTRLATRFGTWDWMGSEKTGEWGDVNWRWLSFDQDHHYAFSFSSSSIDWNRWKITNVPGFGSFDIQHFWGEQSCSFSLFDDHGNCFVELEVQPPCARTNQSINYSSQPPSTKTRSAVALRDSLREDELAGVERKPSSAWDDLSTQASDSPARFSIASTNSMAEI
jgi:hypothetical protein